MDDDSTEYSFPMNWPSACMVVGLAVVLIGGCVANKYMDLTHPVPVKVEAK